MPQEKLIAGLISTGLVLCLLGGFVNWLGNNCSQLSQSDCQTLIGSLGISIVGGIGLTEFFIARRKSQGEWQQHSSSSDDVSPIMTSKQRWFRAVAWVTLSSISATLPIIIQGAIVIAILGFIIGLMISLLVRTVANRLPPPADRS